MAEKTYQMLWDCAYCGTTGLLALDHKHCPACGGAQDPKWRYFPSAEQKVAVEDHVFTGKDLICPACETPNAGGAKFCSNCGSDLDSAKEVQTRAEQSAAEGTSAFAGDDAKKARDEHKAVRKAEREQKVGRTIGAPSGASGGDSGGSSGGGGLKSHLPKIGIAALVVFVVACLGCVGVFALWKKDAKLQSTGHSWERTIAVEQMKEVRESAWQDEVPRGASKLRCKTEKRSTKKVKDGQTCTTKRKDNGDGTYSEREVCKDKYRSEPVYDEKCSYDIDKWVKVRTEKASGSSVKDTPKWPAVRLKRKGSCMGCEREGKRHESYTLHFKADGEKKSCTVPEKTWTRVKVGSKWTGKVGVLSGSLDCSELKPAK
jgi:predicted nucleic acid-binding Zn ribbon protein